MTRRAFNSKAGFTLMEAMIASMILGFVLISVLAICSHCFRYLTDIRRMARSSQVLQQKMEDIRLVTNWGSLTALADTKFYDSADTAGLFTGTVTQATFDSYNGSATVAKVTLTVTWRNRSGRVITNTLNSLVSNGGLNKYIF